MFQGGVSGQNGVVRLDNSCCNLWCWVDSKLKLGFLSVVNRETFHEQRCEARASATTKGMEDEETLQASALVSLIKNTSKHLSELCMPKKLELKSQGEGGGGGGGGGPLYIFGWGCAAGTLKPLPYPRPFSADFGTLYMNKKIPTLSQTCYFLAFLMGTICHVKDFIYI